MEMGKKLSELIYEVEFKQIKSGIFGGDAGYDSTRVDLFLDEIGPKAEKMERENEELKARIKQLEEMQTLSYPSDVTHQDDEEQEMDTTDAMDIFQDAPIQDEDSRRRIRQIRTIEKSSRKILLMAEEEAENIRSEAKEQAKKLIVETQQKADLLLKQVNIRCEEKEIEYGQLNEKSQEIENTLLKIAEYIHQNYRSSDSAIS